MSCLRALKPVEPVVAALTTRYHGLGSWDRAWPVDPAEPNEVDTQG